MLVLLAPVAAATAARHRAADPRRPSCGALLSAAAIAKVNGGYSVTVTTPGDDAALGAWQGPRSVCYAVYDRRSPSATFPGAAAIWGVGYGVSAGQWTAMRSLEGSADAAEGPGPWSRHTVSVGLTGASAFVATTTAGPVNGLGWPAVSYLYVRTARHNLFYLSMFSVRVSRLTALAHKVLLAHPAF